MAGGDWTPEELASLTVGWYQADIITGKNDGDEVDSWTDSSGQSNTLTQTTSGAKPIYKTNIINSLPVLQFDKDASPGDNLLSSDLGGDFDVGTGDFFICLVGRFPTTSGNQFVMTKANGTEGLNVFINSSGTLIFRPQTVGVTTNNIQQTSVTDNKFHTIVCRRVSGVITGHFDGQDFSTDTGSKINNGSINNDNDFRIGSSSTGGLDADMDLPEAIIASGTLSDENRDRLTGYLAWKYGLQANLPDDHAYRFHKPQIEPKIWQGLVNNDLNNGLNWSSAGIPTEKDKVLFNSGAVDATTGSLTAGSVFITDGYTGSIGSTESPLTFTAEKIVLGSDDAELNIRLASNTQTFVTGSGGGVTLSGSGTNLFIRSKNSTTLALTNDNSMSIDVRHPSGKGGLVSHTSGNPLKTTVGFGGNVEHSHSGGSDTVEITGNGRYIHTVSSMPSFFLRGGTAIFDGDLLSGVSDLLGGTLKLGSSSDKATLEFGVVRVYPGGFMDLTGSSTGQVSFAGSKVLTSQGGSILKLGPGRSAAMS